MVSRPGQQCTAQKYRLEAEGEDDAGKPIPKVRRTFFCIRELPCAGFVVRVTFSSSSDARHSTPCPTWCCRGRRRVGRSAEVHKCKTGSQRRRRRSRAAAGCVRALACPFTTPLDEVENRLVTPVSRAALPTPPQAAPGSQPREFDSLEAMTLRAAESSSSFADSVSLVPPSVEGLVRAAKPPLRNRACCFSSQPCCSARLSSQMTASSQDNPTAHAGRLARRSLGPGHLGG